MSTIFKQYSEWIYRGVLLAVACSTLWLNSHYVTIDTYEKDKQAEHARQEKDAAERRAESELATKRLTALETLIQVMAESNKVNDRQDRALTDLEFRVRALEIKIK